MRVKIYLGFYMFFMNRPPILKPGESYTFRKYFELQFNTEDILAELGCSLGREEINLDQSKTINFPNLSEFKEKLVQNLKIVDLNSEAARREVLIAPILLELCNIVQAKLNIEYPIYVSDLLKGNLDYLVLSQSNVLVVEAKNADLSRGFTQLAVELIAVDSWTDSSAEILYGAVTTGDIWRFGYLQRQERKIVQDINLYRVPADIEELLQILVNVVSGSYFV